jgi:hypothetical protein
MNFLYTDAKHKFTLQLPTRWKDVKIKYSNLNEEVKASMDFTMILANEEVSIASIIALDNEEIVKDYVSSGVFHKLGKRNNMTYLYIKRSEAPDQLYEDRYREELKTLRTFIETDVPQVMKTFKVMK